MHLLLLSAFVNHVSRAVKGQLEPICVDKPWSIGLLLRYQSCQEIIDIMVKSSVCDCVCKACEMTCECLEYLRTLALHELSRSDSHIWEGCWSAPDTEPLMQVVISIAQAQCRGKRVFHFTRSVCKIQQRKTNNHK